MPGYSEEKSFGSYPFTTIDFSITSAACNTKATSALQKIGSVTSLPYLRPSSRTPPISKIDSATSAWDGSSPPIHGNGVPSMACAICQTLASNEDGRSSQLNCRHTVGRIHEGEEAARRALELAAQNGLPLPTFAATRLAVRLSFSNRTDESLELARAVEREVISGVGEISRTLAALAVVVAVGGDTPHALELVDRAIADARSVGVVRLLSAIANRLLIAPTDPVSDALSTEAAEIARMTGRTSVLAHTVLAAAHRRVKASGDGREFLRGIAEFVDLQVQNEPTAALGALQLALGPAADANARGAAMLLAAVERLAIEHDHEGTDAERQRREEIRHSLRTELGSQDFDRATVDGEELTLKGAIDLLHWVCDPEASALTGSSTC